MGKYGKPIIVGFVVVFAVSALLGMVGGATGANLGLLPMFVGMFAGGFTALIMANLAGNEKSQAADPEARVRALSLAPPPGKALLVVYRDGFVGRIAGMDFALDGARFVQIKGGWFSVLPIAPGEHRLSGTMAGLAEAQSKAAEVRFIAAAGEVHAYKAALSMGAMKNKISLTEGDPSPAVLRPILERLTLTEAQTV